MSNFRRLLMRNATAIGGIVMPYKQRNCAVGDVLLYDRNKNYTPCVLKASIYSAAELAALDMTRYFNTKAVFFGTEPEGTHTNGLWLSPIGASRQWASNAHIKLTFKDDNGNIIVDSIPAGSFTLKIASYPSTYIQTITWTEVKTVEQIAALINAVKGSVELTCHALKDSNGTRIGIGISYQNIYSTQPTVSNLSTGLNLTLTEYTKDTTKIDGSLLSSTRRVYQASTVQSLFSSLGWPATTTANYSNAGYNLSYRCGGNFWKFEDYFDGNGGSGVVTDSTVDYPMNLTAFNALKNAEEGSVGKLLYDKYYSQWNTNRNLWVDYYGPMHDNEDQGVYDAYIMSRLVNIDTEITGSVCYRWRHDGLEFSRKLASVTFDGLTTEGSYFKESTNTTAYPAAYYCYNIYEIKDGSVDIQSIGKNHWHLPTAWEICLFMRDTIYAKINDACTKVGNSTNKLDYSSYYWSCSEYYSDSAWAYYGHYGPFRDSLKHISYTCRPVLSLTFPS